MSNSIKQTLIFRTLAQFITENKLKCQIVLRDKQTDWLNWISVPENGYLDYGGDPISLSNVISIILSPIVKINIGRLLPPKVNNYKNEIEELLNSTELPFYILDNNFIIKFK